MIDLLLLLLLILSITVIVILAWRVIRLRLHATSYAGSLYILYRSRYNICVRIGPLSAAILCDKMFTSYWRNFFFFFNEWPRAGQQSRLVFHNHFNANSSGWARFGYPLNFFQIYFNHVCVDFEINFISSFIADCLAKRFFLLLISKHRYPV